MNRTQQTLRQVAVALLVFAAVSAARAQSTVLKDAFVGDFLVGAAFSTNQVRGGDPEAMTLAARQFNSITPENLLKWESVHPRPDRYDFEAADAFVEFGEKHDMFIVGHTLVWHSQTPRWVFEDERGQPLGREALLERMRDHIHTVVGRYKGRIHAWDVVNEAIETDRRDERQGSWRNTPWRRIIGPDYIAKAFQFAQEADPDAELYYNDYDEWKPGKHKLFAEIVHELRDKGIRIDGIGLQGHWGLDYPKVDEIRQMFQDLGLLEIALMITELDINVLPSPNRNTGADVSQRAQARPNLNPYPDGLPESVQDELTKRYETIFRIFLENRDSISRVTFWGVDDGQSWRNNWPIAGRTNYPLLFDRNYQPKPAFDAVVRLANDQN